MSSNLIKLMLVDDHQMLIDGIKALLSNEKQFIIAGEYTSPVLALEELDLVLPDIVITDINMPEINGLELTIQIRKQLPACRILALSMHNDKTHISKMLEAGVSGYILKNTGKQELLDALYKIHQGGTYFSREVADEMLNSMSRSETETEVNLTQREREIIVLIAREYSNSQIADELCISERTVETHRKNIFRKTNTKSVVGLIKYALENKLIGNI
jgi:two-component system, NarL family, nitrate/nitrite response regulator NarL